MPNNNNIESNLDPDPHSTGHEAHPVRLHRAGQEPQPDRGRAAPHAAPLQLPGADGGAHERSVRDIQRLNLVLDCECCCCCEQPISMQKIFFTAISLDAHNDIIRFTSKNSASAPDTAGC